MKRFEFFKHVHQHVQCTSELDFTSRWLGCTTVPLLPKLLFIMKTRSKRSRVEDVEVTPNKRTWEMQFLFSVPTSQKHVIPCGSSGVWTIGQKFGHASLEKKDELPPSPSYMEERRVKMCKAEIERSGTFVRSPFRKEYPLQTADDAEKLAEHARVVMYIAQRQMEEAKKVLQYAQTSVKYLKTTDRRKVMWGSPVSVTKECGHILTPIYSARKLFDSSGGVAMEAISPIKVGQS